MMVLTMVVKLKIVMMIMLLQVVVVARLVLKIRFYHNYYNIIYLLMDVLYLQKYYIF